MAYDGSKEAKKLRQKIIGTEVPRLGWDKDMFYQIMAGIGFGTSLRALDYEELKELHEILSTYKREAAARYDKQGKYMYALQMRAGWTDHQLRSFMCLHFRKLHWNVLDQEEKRKVIDMLKACQEER